MELYEERLRLLRHFESYRDVDSYAAAVPMYEQALRESPDNTNDLFDLAYLNECRARQLLENAAELYEHALRHASKNTDANRSYFKVLNHLIRNLIFSDNTHVAIQKVKDLILADPDDPLLYCNLCQCYMFAHQVDDAEKAINAALKLDDRHAYVLHYAGDVAKSKGRYEQALNYWRASYAADATLEDNLYSIAMLYEFLGRTQEAISTWEEIASNLKKGGWDIEMNMPLEHIEKLRMMRNCEE